MCFDFSSAFNTIQTYPLDGKLLKLGTVPNSFIRWILRYLTNRSQYVRLTSNVDSDVIVSNTGVPRGTALAPFFFTVYTSDIRSSQVSCPFFKFADGTAPISLIHVMMTGLSCKLLR